MSRAVNLELSEAEVRPRCHESGVSISAIEPLQSGGTPLVCTTGDGADEIRLRLCNHLIRGAVRRFPSTAREARGDGKQCPAQTMENEMDLDHSQPETLDFQLAANDQTDAPSATDVVVKRRGNETCARFDIYRADQVRLTSALFGGGDWHWRLSGAAGGVIADCGGYRNEAQCLAAVKALRLEAGLAPIFHNAG